MSDISHYLRSDYAGMELYEILHQPLSALLGVDADAVNALKEIGIESVFDLGGSWLFANASAAAAVDQLRTVSERLGLAPSNLLKPTASFETVSDIPQLPLEHLSGLTEAEANALKSALDVTTIRDFALWPPRQAAHKLVSDAAGTAIDLEEEESEALRPRFGEYPTERVYYSRLTMLQMGDDSERNPLQQPISLMPTLEQPIGFGKPAVGVLLTSSQSWYARGVTLGHMLHSLALAPGEATRIAVIDWTRRTSASAAEAITETEQLDNSTLHARAISEVQNAVATEEQQGGSMSSGWAKSSSLSAAASASTGLIPSLYVSASGSLSYQEASTETFAQSASWSVGSRSISADMTQTVNDRTEQHASSVRNRRATAVREVSQSEHEAVSTRIVANYNHMHALTIQYYEVVQVYQVVSKLHQAERCLFVPFELLDFGIPNAMDIVQRFRGALVRGALTARARDLLIDDTEMVAIKSKLTPSFQRPRLSGVSDERIMALRVSPEGASTSEQPVTASEETENAAVTHAVYSWDRDKLMRISRVIGRSPLRPGSNFLHLPDETELVALSFSGVNLSSVRLARPGIATSDNTFTIPAGTAQVDLPPGILLGDLDAISVSRAADDTLHAGYITLHCSYHGRPLNTVPLPIQLTPGTAMQKIVDFQPDTADRRKELLEHLQANRAHYSQVVFQSLDSATLVMLLSPFTWNGKALIDQIEPNALAIAGNFVVFRAPIEGDDHSGVMSNGNDLTWDAVLEERGINFTISDTRLVPIPTDGVFAEAVLGRSNSAEKLDITRFWNWQDSPIPLQPTEIAPVGTGSRGVAEELTPGSLSSPLLNIVNPTSLPDPAGLSASLGALATANLFRDMSGLQGTQALSEAALKETLEAASEAGQLASTNLKTEAQKAVEMGKIAADVAKAAMRKDSKSSTKGMSAEGARINHGRDMDERGIQGSSAVASGSGEFGEGAGGNGGDSGKTNPYVGKHSNEKRYADQGALNYSPDALKDATSSIAQPSSAKASTSKSKGKKADEDTLSYPLEDTEMTQYERAELRILEYVQDTADVITAAHEDAFKKFKAWYLDFVHKQKSASTSTIKDLMSFLFETVFSSILPGGGVYVSLLTGAAKKLLKSGLKALGSPEHVDPQFVIARLEVVESNFVTRLSTLHIDYANPEGPPNSFDTAVNAFIENIEYDPGPPGLPQEVKDILQWDGIPEPTAELRLRVTEKTLTHLIEIIIVNTLVPQGNTYVNLAKFVGTEPDRLALLNALRQIDPVGNKERICKLEREIFGAFANRECL
jgi:hypothetical protein